MSEGFLSGFGAFGRVSSLLSHNSLLAVCELPDELFQPYASSTTSVVVLEKGIPHNTQRKTVFVRLQYDGLTLKKGPALPDRIERIKYPQQLMPFLIK